MKKNVVGQIVLIALHRESCEDENFGFIPLTEVGLLSRVDSYEMIFGLRLVKN